MTQNPVSQETVYANATATLTAAASGSPAPTVQWEYNTGSGGFTGLSNNNVYSGVTTGTLTITAPTPAMSGYQYEAVFNNSAGNATTTPATLIVPNVQPPNLSADSPLTDGSLLLSAASAGLNYVGGAATGQVVLSADAASRRPTATAPG